MTYRTDDLRIASIRDVVPPHILHEGLPLSEAASATVYHTRKAVQEIMNREDTRLLVIAGPCSIHDPDAALDYATRLKRLIEELEDDLLIVMRVYFEKPRTTVGWKGLINDPDLDGSFQINEGLRLARQLLLRLAEMGVGSATEFLDLISPQYVADLVSWGAIGARTTESQVHRELASGLSCPVGFKNGTDGNLQIAVDALRSAAHPHHFLSLTKKGHSAIFATTGNPDCHIILRGGARPNYDAQSIREAGEMLAQAGLPQRLMIDCSHANSLKDPTRQLDACRDVAAQLMQGERRIFGVMLESHLVAGRQDLKSGAPLRYGQSITDACIGWEDSEAALRQLAKASRGRRDLLAASAQDGAAEVS